MAKSEKKDSLGSRLKGKEALSKEKGLEAHKDLKKVQEAVTKKTDASRKTRQKSLETSRENRMLREQELQASQTAADLRRLTRQRGNKS